MSKKKITSSLKKKTQLSRPNPRKSKEKKKAMLLLRRKTKTKQNKNATSQLYCLREKKKNKGNLKKLSIKKKFISTQFSLHFGKKTFWWVRGEKT